MPRQPVFFTRKYPPSIGGMETLAAGVWRSLVTARPRAHLIAHGGANSRLPLWFPVALARLWWLLQRGRVEVVLTGDALAHALVSPLARLYRVPLATMVMGLDVTYNNPLYRALVLPSLRRAPVVLAISAATAVEVVKAGVPSGQVAVLRLGVDAPSTTSAERAAAREQLHQRLGLDPDAITLLTLGRLVRRKGVRWFTDEVLPSLDPGVHYLVAGDGPELDEVCSTAKAAGVAHRVHLLGRVEDELRELLLIGADLFVQPNIAVPGDMEGFGLVTIEAALRGTPVVAADLEGIKDAVVDGATGQLLPSADGPAWVARLTILIGDLAALDALGGTYQEAAAQLYGEAAMGAALIAALPTPQSSVAAGLSASSRRRRRTGGRPVS